jgi:hypothetical protein
MEGPLTTEDYVAIDVGLFGSPGARTKLSIEDFALRLNGRKTPLPSQPYGSVAASVQDPEWAPPEAAEPKSKSGLSTGAKTEDSGPPSPPKVPIALKRAWAQRVQRAAIPLGDRSLPQGGLIFFLYGGKIRSLESIELIYTGPDGKATLKLQP